MDYIPITITQDNLAFALRSNILQAFQVLDTKLKVSGAQPLNTLNASGNKVVNIASAKTLYSAVTLQDLLAMFAGTFTIPANPDAVGNNPGPGVYPSKPQGGPSGPTIGYGGRVLGDTAGDGN